MAGVPRIQNRRLPSPDKKNELLDQLVATIERHFCNGKTSQDLEVGARALVEGEIYFGIIDPAEVDVEERVCDYARRGLTIDRVLEQISGTTRGLPSLMSCNLKAIGGGDDQQE
jgi:hypothetical protein